MIKTNMNMYLGEEILGEKDDSKEEYIILSYLRD